MMEPWDVIILGAGSAGLAALREVEKKTRSVLLINDGPYGTTCARVGCMPSKALIEAATAFHARHRHAAFGICGSAGLTIDVPAVLRRVRSLRDRFVAGTREASDELGERSIAGRARLRGPGQIEVGGRVYHARKIVIATGSRPIVPKQWQGLGERLLTTDTLFDQETLPQRVGVVGLGAIGIEFAQALARLGMSVTAFGEDARLAGLSDDKVNAVLRGMLDEVLTVHTGASVELSGTQHGVLMRAAAIGVEVEVDRVLVAVGRTPNVDDMGLECLGLPLDERGLPPFNPQTTQVDDLPVFIAGDANAYATLLHEAADEGYIAGFNAVADDALCFQRRTPLGIVFTDPAVALVGQRHAELDAAQTLIGEVCFDNQGRARIAQRNQGLLRLYAERGGGRLLGAEMCGPAVEHMAHLLALAIGQGLTVQDLLGMPFYHPVLEEGLRSALRDLARQLGKGAPDLAACNAYRTEALD